MSLLLKVIGGAMAGIGKGMVAQAELDAQAARDAVLYQREVALRNLQIDAQNKLADKQHGQRLEEIDRTGTQQRLTQRSGAIYDDWKAGRQTDRNTEAQKELKSIDFKNDIKARQLASRLNIIESDFNSKVQAGEIVQDAEGGYHLVDKRSAAVKPVGVKGPTKDAEDDWTQFRRESTGGGTSKSGGAATQPRNAIEAYENATPETHPRLFRPDGTKIPRNEFMRLWNSEG